MPVDSFKYLPRAIAAFYQMTELQPELPIPWTPLPHALAECKFSLVTSGGLYQRGVEPPFDLEREKQEPTWGDPTYRRLPADIQQEEVGASHLHLNLRDVLEDFNILLPIRHFQALAKEGRIGGLARHVYSFMGYQGFPPDTHAWQETYGPQLAEELKTDGISCVLLVPA